ncbi:hypothetical protein [Bradyrhizobium sp. 17]|uniref:hypothetical protein n=1 Tax=Bradyrhizobium sp. 17 TaxID=2782649 RepID=UPI001FF9AC02|nr:hypothetical protein [Bradyrhizobium sp. 17]MCK1525137.1 hypothetical protein [Bradyrhizobium sp. 17]
MQRQADYLDSTAGEQPFDNRVADHLGAEAPATAWATFKWAMFKQTQKIAQVRPIHH